MLDRSTRRGVALAAGVVLVLLTGGCGEDSASPTARTAQTSGPASPSLPPAGESAATGTEAEEEWSREEAGEQYLAMVQDSNQVMDRLGVFWRANVDKTATPAMGETLAEMCSDWAAAQERLLREMQAGLWPAPAQRHIDDLMAQTASSIAAIQDCAEGEDTESVVVALTEAVALIEDNGAAVQVRVALGLPLPE